MDNDALSTRFAEYANQKLRDHLVQIRRCVGLLSPEQLWYRPNENSNSVGNLLLHLRGNVGQWILAGIGGAEISRDRQAEFDRREPILAETVIGELEQTVEAAAGVIAATGAEALSRSFNIQEYDVTGVEAIFHVVEHFAFHTGQIVTTTKWLLDVDLSLYDENGHRRDGRLAGTP